MKKHIRNFVIIAHVDHGKSTLADRLLEITGTIEKRKMKEQVLDQLELERERGITIKMAPVRMHWTYERQEYELNLIDTPGHSDFSYEVSRSLNAVEGAILLVDATQGVQAQTLANFYAAQQAGLTIIGALNKVDLMEHEEDREKAKEEVALLLGCETKDIHCISGKTGEGVEKILADVVTKIPEPKEIAHRAKGLIFDSFYDNHKGVIASVRVFGGPIRVDDEVVFIATGEKAKLKEVGCFLPALSERKELFDGEIGYIVAGIKDPEKVKIGDTVVVRAQGEEILKSEALSGYKEPQSSVFVSFYPEEADDYELLKKSLQKLRLNDSALSIEPDQNEVLGRGYKVGFLGRLHFEITGERLKREFLVDTINSFPSVKYRVLGKDGWIEIVKPEEMPENVLEIWEPMIDIHIIVPQEFLPNIMAIQKKFRMEDVKTETRGERIEVVALMPLAELISDFDDHLKSSTKGLASFSYSLREYKKADVVRVDVCVSDTHIAGLSRFLPKETVEREARKMAERLKTLLPKEQWSQAIQIKAGGRIIAREDIQALRKDVTGYLYGGDRTRKMKLWKKQQKGKKRLKERAETNTNIPPSVFKELLKK